MDCFHKASLLAVRIYIRDQVRGHGMRNRRKQRDPGRVQSARV